MPKLVAIVYVRKEGITHFESMLAWLRENVGVGNFQWFGYNMSHKTHTMIHFYNEEAAVAFSLAWKGSSRDR
jgi:hypothetical protein